MAFLSYTFYIFIINMNLLKLKLLAENYYDYGIRKIFNKKEESFFLNLKFHKLVTGQINAGVPNFYSFFVSLGWKSY